MINFNDNIFNVDDEAMKLLEYFSNKAKDILAMYEKEKVIAELLLEYLDILEIKDCILVCEEINFTVTLYFKDNIRYLNLQKYLIKENDIYHITLFETNDEEELNNKIGFINQLYLI